MALLFVSMIPRTSPASVLARTRIREMSVEPVVATATHLAVVALTGGLRSPFLIAVIGPYTGILQNYGWTRSAKLALGMIAGATAAMALSPPAWFGPRISEPAFFQVARAFRADEALRRICLVAVSGYALGEDVERARDAGFDRHLAKPVRVPALEELFAALGRDGP